MAASLTPLRCVFWALVVAGNLPAYSWASDAVACEEAQTQTAMTKCFGAQAEEAQAALVRDIAAYIARLGDGQRVLFLASQSTWEKYRAAACEFQASGVDGGSSQSMVYSACFETLTNKRRQEIAELAACEEGDLSCPAHQ